MADGCEELANKVVMDVGEGRAGVVVVLVGSEQDCQDCCTDVVRSLEACRRDSSGIVGGKGGSVAAHNGGDRWVPEVVVDAGEKVASGPGPELTAGQALEYNVVGVAEKAGVAFTVFVGAGRDARAIPAGVLGLAELDPVAKLACGEGARAVGKSSWVMTAVSHHLGDWRVEGVVEEENGC